MSTPAPSPVPVPVAPARTSHRTAPVDSLLDGLEALVTRHRALTSEGLADQNLHAELIGAEIAHELAIAQARLRRPPHLSVVGHPEGSR